MPRPTQSQGRPSPGTFLSRMPFHKEIVKVIRNEGTDSEETAEVWAHVQADAGFFDLDTPIFEGDVVEVSDARRGPDGTERRLAAKVDVNRSGQAAVDHIHVKWGRAVPPRQAPVRRLTFENLHPEVQASAGDLFCRWSLRSSGPGGNQVPRRPRAKPDRRRQVGSSPHAGRVPGDRPEDRRFQTHWEERRRRAPGLRGHLPRCDARDAKPRCT
jgi:hypothetical protein